jgi:hypothetical protein
MIVKIGILEENDDKEVCLLAEDIFNRLELSEGVNYNIHAGQRIIGLSFKVSNDCKEEIRFSDEHIKNLLIYKGQKINIWKGGEDIYLGPAIGILVTPEYLRNLREGNISLSDKKWFEANEEACCLLYYFTKENIYINDGMVYGFTYIAEISDFDFVSLPLPQVVYEQTGRLKDSEVMAYAYMKNILTNRLGIRYFKNRTFLGRWETFLALSDCEDCKRYIPVTISYDSFNDAAFMLDSFNSILLKYAYGTKGREILSIEKVSSGYKVINRENRDKYIFLDDIESLKKLVEEYVGNRFFIINQGIPFIKLTERVVLQKDGMGEWILLNSHRTSLVEKVIKDIVKIAQCLEKRWGFLGQLEMDVAIDDIGRLWFIEVETDEINGVDALSILKYTKIMLK